MKKEEIRLHFLNDFSFGQSSVQTAANMCRVGAEGSTCDQTV